MMTVIAKTTMVVVTVTKKPVMIGASLFVVFMVSLLPILYAGAFGGPISGYFRYTYYINNLANFFIYLFVDEEFRASLKAMCRG